MRVADLVEKVVVAHALLLFFVALTPSIVFVPARALRRRVARLPLVSRVSSTLFFITVVLSIASLTMTCGALFGGICTQTTISQRCAATMTLANILLSTALVFQTVAMKALLPSTRLARSLSLNIVFRLISDEESIAHALTTLALLRAATTVISQRWSRARGVIIFVRRSLCLCVVVVGASAVKGSSYFVCTSGVGRPAGAAAVFVSVIL